jgi:hypothetical protein
VLSYDKKARSCKHSLPLFSSVGWVGLRPPCRQLRAPWQGLDGLPSCTFARGGKTAGGQRHWRQRLPGLRPASVLIANAFARLLCSLGGGLCPHSDSVRHSLCSKLAHFAGGSPTRQLPGPWANAPRFGSQADNSLPLANVSLSPPRLPPPSVGLLYFSLHKHLDNTNDNFIMIFIKHYIGVT